MRRLILFIVISLLLVIACSKSPTKSEEQKPINFKFTAENNTLNIYRIFRCIFPSVGVPIVLNDIVIQSGEIFIDTITETIEEIEIIIWTMEWETGSFLDSIIIQTGIIDLLHLYIQDGSAFWTTHTHYNSNWLELYISNLLFDDICVSLLNNWQQRWFVEAQSMIYDSFVITVPPSSIFLVENANMYANEKVLDKIINVKNAYGLYLILPDSISILYD